MYGSALKALQELLVGATVLAVEPPGEDEYIARFLVEKDGKQTSFMLGATDLGSWVSRRQTEITEENA